MRSFLIRTLFIATSGTIFFFPHYFALAQSPPTQEETSLLRNRLSVGAGYGTFMGRIGFPVWSAMYSRAIAQNLEAEISLFNGGNSSFQSVDLTHTIVSPNYYRMIFWNLTNLDISLLWTPSGTPHGFRFGLGGTLQYGTFGSAETHQGSIGWMPLDSLLRMYPPSFYEYSTSWILGTHLTADYIFPLSNVVDMGLRVKGYLFFLGLTNGIPRIFTSGAATANVFVGVRF